MCVNIANWIADRAKCVTFRGLRNQESAQRYNILKISSRGIQCLSKSDNGRKIKLDFPLGGQTVEKGAKDESAPIGTTNNEISSQAVANEL